MAEIILKVKETISRFDLIKKNEWVIAAVSGGPDSMALLYVLHALKTQVPFKLSVLHINHLLRGADSQKDASFVERICAGIKVPFCYREVDVLSYKKEHSLSLEEAGRICRRNIYFETLDGREDAKIALGHTMEDQAETFLMRILCGSGSHGLSCMDMISMGIIRPLLDISRERIIDFLKINKIKFVVDLTNKNISLVRNRIRHKLLPRLKKDFNPKISEALFRTACLVSKDSGYLDSVSGAEFKGAAIIGNSCVSIKIADVLKMHDAVKSRVLREAYKHVRGSLDNFGFIHYLKLNELLEKQTGTQIALPGGIIARVQYGQLEILKDDFCAVKPGCVLLNIGGRTAWDSASYFNSCILDIKPKSLNCGKDVIFVDYDKCGGEIIIRSRRDGDRFFPFGFHGSMKLKKFFIDSRLPRHLRDSMPVLETDGKIIWVAPMRMDARFAVEKSTRRILMIQFCRYEIPS